MAVFQKCRLLANPSTFFPFKKISLLIYKAYPTSFSPFKCYVFHFKINSTRISSFIIKNKLLFNGRPFETNIVCFYFDVKFIIKKMAARRDISPILQTVRDVLLKRKNLNFLRFREDIAARTQPPPNLPDGPNAKLAANYYYTRDARRLVKPEEILVEGSTMKKLPEGGEKPATVLQRVPGKVYNWDM